MSEEKRKPEPAAEKSESEEQESQPTPSRQSRGGGWIFPAVILLVFAAWCAYDGFYVSHRQEATGGPGGTAVRPGGTEPGAPGGEAAEKSGGYVLFNQICAIVLGALGLGLLVYEGLRPRNAPKEPVFPPDAESGPPRS